jgi:hypothetical protein
MDETDLSFGWEVEAWRRLRAAGILLPVGVGVNFGVARVGNVGDGQIQEFTVVGDVMKTADSTSGGRATWSDRHESSVVGALELVRVSEKPVARNPGSLTGRMLAIVDGLGSGRHDAGIGQMWQSGNWSRR